jgi:biotin carboxylase
LYPNFRIPFVFQELDALGAFVTNVHPPSARIPDGVPGRNEFLALDVHADPDNAMRALRELHARERFDAVFTVHEPSVLFCALLARELGLRGLDPKTALLARDKSKMRAAFRAAGCNSPAYAVIDSDARELPAGLQFPVVVKPIGGFSSQGVVRANDTGELRSALAAIAEINRDVLDGLSDAKVGHFSGSLVEEYIDGKEYAAECFAQNGTVYVLSIAEKNELVGPYFEELEYIVPARLDEATLERALPEIEKGVLALGIVDGHSHVEFRVRDGVPYIVEIGARMGASGLADFYVSMSSGERPTQLIIRNLLGGADVSALPRRPAPRFASANYVLPTRTGGVMAGIDGIDEVRRHPAVRCVLEILTPGTVIPPYPKFGGYPAFVMSQHASADDAFAFHRWLDDKLAIRYEPAYSA